MRLSLAVKWNSNTLANLTRRLIGQRQEFASVYSAIYRRSTDVISDIASDWLTWLFYVADEAYVWCKCLVQIAVPLTNKC